MVQARRKALGPTRDKRLVKVGAGIDDQPLAALKGTRAREAAVQRRRVARDHPGLPARRRRRRPTCFDQAMTKPWLSSQARRGAPALAFQKFAQHGCVYMAEFADDAILGTALELDKDEAAAGRAVQAGCGR